MATARRPPPRARPRRRRSPWTPVLATLAGVAVLVAAFLVIRWATTPAAQPAPATTVSADQLTAELAAIPQSELDQVGIGSASPLVKRISGTALNGPDGRPEVLYVGGEFCPYCAAERWPLVIALSRFGSLSGLRTAQSSATDVFPSTPTLTFRSAAYRSQVVDLVAVEEFGDSPGQTLHPLTPAQQALVQQYGSGSIPFVYFGGRAVLSGATYSPGLLQGWDWPQVTHALQTPTSDQARAILGSANLLTAAICQASGAQPDAVCASAGVKAAASHLQ
jgi:Domain of unknown function (DUF929)